MLFWDNTDIAIMKCIGCTGIQVVLADNSTLGLTRNPVCIFKEIYIVLAEKSSFRWRIQVVLAEKSPAMSTWSS